MVLIIDTIKDKGLLIEVLRRRRWSGISRVYKGLGIGYNVADAARESSSGLVLNGRKPLSEIRTFRGTFYNPSIVEDMSEVVAPPYDIIDDRRQQELLSRSPYNVVRLVLPQPESNKDFWDEAAAYFNAWKKGEVLIVDTGPCLYVYRQTFNLPDSGPVHRTGILAVLRCKDFSSGDILPHEKTFPRTRAERLNLLRACKANFSQIFTVYRDPQEEALPILEGAVSEDVFIDFSDVEGRRHQLWRIEDASVVEKLVRIFADRRLIIADGHHRYETSLIFSKEKKDSDADGYPSGYVSVAFFRSEDPGLVILPVHRLLRHLPVTVEEAYHRISRHFHIEILQRDLHIRQGMFQENLDKSSRPGFIMLTTQGAALLLLRDEVDPTKILKGPESDRWKSLDVSILHSLILGESLGLRADSLAEEGDLYFTPWESKALSDVSEKQVEAAFLSRPTKMQDIWEIAAGGERMPHKSSYFYPKLPSGLVIYDHSTAFF